MVLEKHKNSGRDILRAPALTLQHATRSPFAFPCAAEQQKWCSSGKNRVKLTELDAAILARSMIFHFFIQYA